ncbi:MAG: peptide-N-glycosidase, partial [Marinilabiliaceae bacterium]
MKKIFLLLGILGLVAFPAKAGQQDTIYVTTHDQITINTDMETGENFFTKWGEFPTPDKDIRRMKMQVTLGHPDTMAIAHWDYLDFIHLRRIGGKEGESKDLEIGRIITPYGSSFT